jgi:hypothetical protein
MQRTRERSRIGLGELSTVRAFRIMCSTSRILLVLRDVLLDWGCFVMKHEDRLLRARLMHRPGANEDCERFSFEQIKD